jgi:hypothetical protein
LPIKSLKLEDGVEIEIMWIPSHVGLEGNEIVDERARHAALNGVVFDEPLPPMDFQGFARSILLREWQGKWDAADTGRFHTPEGFSSSLV